MKKVFLDTNVFVRFYVDDGETHNEQAKILIESIQEGKLAPYTSSIVLSELNYVLLKLYNVHKKQVIEKLTKIFELRNLVLVERTNIRKAVQYYETHNLKFGDCMIIPQVLKNMPFITFDRDFKKVKGLQVLTPGEVVSLLEKK